MTEVILYMVRGGVSLVRAFVFSANTSSYNKLLIKNQSFIFTVVQELQVMMCKCCIITSINNGSLFQKRLVNCCSFRDPLYKYDTSSINKISIYFCKFRVAWWRSRSFSASKLSDDVENAMNLSQQVPTSVIQSNDRNSSSGILRSQSNSVYSMRHSSILWSCK